MRIEWSAKQATDARRGEVSSIASEGSGESERQLVGSRGPLLVAKFEQREAVVVILTHCLL